jgi:hypothetical protein
MYKLALAPFTEHSRQRAQQKTLPTGEEAKHTVPLHVPDRSSIVIGSSSNTTSAFAATSSASSGHLPHHSVNANAGVSASAGLTAPSGDASITASSTTASPVSPLLPQPVPLAATRGFSRDMHRPASSSKLQLVPNSPRAKGDAETLALTKQIVAAEVFSALLQLISLFLLLLLFELFFLMKQFIHI